MEIISIQGDLEHQDSMGIPRNQGRWYSGERRYRNFHSEYNKIKISWLNFTDLIYQIKKK
jgi:hypothetical protein